MLKVPPNMFAPAQKVWKYILGHLIALNVLRLQLVGGATTCISAAVGSSGTRAIS